MMLVDRTASFRSRVAIALLLFCVLFLLPACGEDVSGVDKEAKGTSAKQNAAGETETTAAETAAKKTKSERDDKFVFVHRARSGNVSDNSTYIDTPTSKGDPDATLFVTQVRPVDGDAVKNARSIGVWYDANRERWAIFNQDRAPMPEGAAFNVAVAQETTNASDAVFVQRAASGNVADNSTYIDDPLTNGDPDAVLSITPNWNPGGGGGTYNDHPVGVWYDANRERWAIFNQDRAPMPEGVAFNVAVAQETTKANSPVIRATPDTIAGNSAYIDRSFGNESPGTVLSVTQSWNPGGEGGVYNDHPAGIRYDADRDEWAVYNEDGTPMPEGASFNVLEYSDIAPAVEVTKRATGSEKPTGQSAQKESSQEPDKEPQKIQAPIEGKVSKDALDKVPKFRDFYSKGNPETSENLVQAGSSAGAIPAVEPFNFGRDPGGPDNKTLYLSVPKIDLYDVPVYNSTSEEDLNRSAVHVPATGFPWQNGANTFIAGHRIGYPDTGSYYVFFRLDELVDGDEITVTDSDGGRYVYEVRDQSVVGTENVESMNPVEGKSVISLQTCTLPDYAERLIVRGELVEKDV